MMTTTTGTSSSIASPAAAVAGESPSAPLSQRVLVGSAGAIFALVLLPVMLLMHVPFAGWAIGAVAVIANRALHALVAWLVRDSSITVVLGALGFSMFLRVMITGVSLLLVGARFGTGGESVGLGRPDLAMPAIIVFVLCYTLDAGIEAIRRAAQREREAAMAAAHHTPSSSSATIVTGDHPE